MNILNHITTEKVVHRLNKKRHTKKYVEQQNMNFLLKRTMYTFIYKRKTNVLH